MKNSDQRMALFAFHEHADEAVLLRDRARYALAWMAPNRRAMRRGLYAWVEHTSEVLEFNARGQAAVLALHMGYKAMKAAVAVWVLMIASRAERERKVSLCLARTSPEKRDSLLGFESLACRAPAWERGALYTHISSNGFGLSHLRDRSRDAAVGSPKLHQGDLYTFAFAVVGGGAGVVIGVADANYLNASDAEECGGAWGINLSHGALFSKKSLVDRGELHSQQILPLPSIDRSEKHHLDNMIEVEVEVDLRKKPYRIAFGVPDEPMVEASTANITAETLRPWVYMWGEADAVVLLPRRRPRQARMQTWKHAVREPLSFRPASTLSPQKALKYAGMSGAPSGAPASSAVVEEVAMGSPAGAEENAPSSGAPAGALGAPAGAPATAAAAPAPSSTTARASRVSKEGATRLIGRRQSVSLKGGTGPLAMANLKESGGGKKKEGAKSHRKIMLEYAKKGLPDGYTFYDDPKRKQKEALASERAQTERAGQLLEFAERHHANLAKKGTAPKRYPWDRARPVTQTYCDFWTQQQ